MRFEKSEQAPCPACGWENALLRKVCRNCASTLLLHPDPPTDREVRQDLAEAIRMDQSLGLR